MPSSPATPVAAPPRLPPSARSCLCSRPAVAGAPPHARRAVPHLRHPRGRTGRRRRRHPSALGSRTRPWDRQRRAQGGGTSTGRQLAASSMDHPTCLLLGVRAGQGEGAEGGACPNARVLRTSAPQPVPRDAAPRAAILGVCCPRPADDTYLVVGVGPRLIRRGCPGGPPPPSARCRQLLPPPPPPPAGHSRCAACRAAGGGAGHRRGRRLSTARAGEDDARPRRARRGRLPAGRSGCAARGRRRGAARTRRSSPGPPLEQKNLRGGGVSCKPRRCGRARGGAGRSSIGGVSRFRGQPVPRRSVVGGGDDSGAPPRRRGVCQAA